MRKMVHECIHFCGNHITTKYTLKSLKTKVYLTMIHIAVDVFYFTFHNFLFCSLMLVLWLSTTVEIHKCLYVAFNYIGRKIMERKIISYV